MVGGGWIGIRRRLLSSQVESGQPLYYFDEFEQIVYWSCMVSSR
jgi:hypothetical protein